MPTQTTHSTTVRSPYDDRLERALGAMYTSDAGTAAECAGGTLSAVPAPDSWCFTPDQAVAASTGLRDVACLIVIRDAPCIVVEAWGG